MPPAAIVILGVAVNDGNFQVEFSAAVDGSLLDDGWIEDLTAGCASAGFLFQASPTVCLWATDGPSVDLGDSWQIAIEQSGIAFPQSGVVS